LARPHPCRIQWDYVATTGRYAVFHSDLEQVHVRSLFSRVLRLEVVAGFGIAFAMPALALAQQSSGLLATQTTLTAETHDQDGRTRATLNIAVTSEDGLPAAGAVVINDHGKPLAGVALDAKGRATAAVELVSGSHTLSATYKGDSKHLDSVSLASPVGAVTGTAPDFSVVVAPTTLTLKQGQSGSAVASVTAINAASLTAPMFVTISCAGLPDQTSCSFTPENIEITPTTTTAITSTMVVATQAASLAKSVPMAHAGSNPVAWAFLLPGTLALVGLAFGTRRRRWVSRFVLMALVGFVTVLGATACSPLYNYRNHGPPPNLPTPVGTYTVTVNAQSSNGVTATTHSTTLALTVTK
jgi:hypothetical protein